LLLNSTASPADVFEILRSERIGGHEFELSGSRDVIGHVSNFLLVSFGTKPLSLTVSEIFSGECDTIVDMTLIQPLNKGQGHSFW